MSSALVLLLAQVCVWEAGLTAAYTQDCPAIVQVLRTRGQLFTAAYSTYGRRESQRPWVYGLDVTLEEPDKWPRTLSWDNNRYKWVRILLKVERALAYPWNPCRRRTPHWAAPWHNLKRMRAAGWVRSDCGWTLNYFWRRP